MQFDIQTTIQDNVRLKKTLQMSKFSLDKLQKQHKQLKKLYEQSLERNTFLKKDYCQLQKKYQHSFSQSIKDNNSLISQIEQLKNIIDKKQRDMEQLQIKLIPNLDQDMLRVKLIAQMEGPYQETVDKKDKQIQKLKNKTVQLQRNLEILGLSFKTKTSELKKQREQIKQRYEDENNRLMQQLNISLSRNEVYSIQSSIIKNQKKEISQLKATVQFMESNQQKHIQQINLLKYQRNQLLEKLMHLNSKQALLLQSRHNVVQVQKLKQQKIKLNQQADKLKIQNQKQARQILRLQQEKIKLQNQFERQLNEEKNKTLSQRNVHNNELYEIKEELRRLKNGKIQTESDRQNIYERMKTLEQQIYQKNRENETLRLECSRYTQEAGCWDGFCKGTRVRQEQESKQRKQKQNDYTIFNRNKGQVAQKKSNKLVNELTAENQKLRNKLRQANDKILQLLKQKLANGQNISPQRDQRERIKSSMERVDKDQKVGVFLQYEDCSFKPLVEPTLYTYHQPI